MSEFNSKRYLAELTTALNEHDPIRLIESGAPADEYNYERSLISGPLLRCASAAEVLDLVYMVFCDCFDVKTAGPREPYEPLADELWRIREHHRPEARNVNQSPKAR